MNHAGNAIWALVVGLVASSLMVCVAANANSNAVGLCSDPNWTDTNANTEGEVYNLIGLIADHLGHDVVNISDYSRSSQWHYAMNHTKAILFTEVESDKKRTSSPTDDIGTAVRDDLIDWITTREGRLVIFDGGDWYDFFLDYEASFKRAEEEAAPSHNYKRGLPYYAKTPEAADLALFASAPAKLEVIDVCHAVNIQAYVDVYGSNFTCLYGTNSSCAAWMYAKGNGHYFGVCVDYYDARPRGTQDGGWVDVLGRMITMNSSSRLANSLTALLHLVYSFLS